MKTWRYLKQSRRFLFLKVNKSRCLGWIQMLQHNLSLLREKRVYLMSAEDETYEEKEETPVDVIKDRAKGDVDPEILSKQ
ncbi:hypothetical protein TNCV_1847431 [Trichonephila clavipes]|nr:hypothetical protein TNCV_1847431 [Trichonephila clavipes]